MNIYFILGMFWVCFGYVLAQLLAEVTGQILDRPSTALD